MLETAERLTAEEREPSLRLFLLVIGALRALSERDPSLVLDAFLLRAMSVSGYAPALLDCARCGAAGPHRAFSVPAGGTVCASCRPAGAASPSPVDPGADERPDGGGVGRRRGDRPRTRRDASGLVAAHLQWHLERGLRSLPLVERA